VKARAALVAIVAACGSSALPPAGQLRIGVDTDALLPPAPGDPPGPRQWLFDRLRVELFAPGESEPCAGCTREFGIEHRTVFEGRASFGFVPEVGVDGYRARIRLFRSVGAATAEPRRSSTLESVVALPPTQADGVVDVHVVLQTSSVGAPVGTLDAPEPALPGSATGGTAGTFAADVTLDCAGTPRADETCVPGGAYWMGDLTLGTGYGSVSSERLVTISPFYMDKTEVTVGAFRASGVTTRGRVLPAETQKGCTFTSALGANEDLPLTCVTRPGALAYCATKGARLPTEAEWELVSGGRRSAREVWGDDPARCEDVVAARAPGVAPTEATGACTTLGEGLARPGTGGLDRLVLPTGTIVDVEGNLTEWMSDAWSPEGSPCWRAPLLADPVCHTGTDYVVRGGSFAQPLSQLRAAIRAQVSSDGDPFSTSIGFRCVRH
jgi:formylglycine-generating enzyme required for sulfatase activity